MGGYTEHYRPEPPTDLLLATRDVVALRVHGRPRDPESGVHKQVVVFAAPTMTPGKLAGYLRDAADRLDLVAEVNPLAVAGSGEF